MGEREIEGEKLRDAQLPEQTVHTCDAVVRRLSEEQTAEAICFTTARASATLQNTTAAGCPAHREFSPKSKNALSLFLLQSNGSAEDHIHIVYPLAKM